VPDEVAELQALAGVQLAVVTSVGHNKRLIVQCAHVSLPRLKSDGSVEGEGDTPALVVLVHVELENVSLTVGPPGGCLHPGADCGLAPGPANRNTYRQ